MTGIDGIRQALSAEQQLLNIEAANLTRSQIPGAQEVRGTLTGNDTLDFGNAGTASGPGVRLAATTLDFSQGQLNRTGFTTDMAISGNGMFVLMNTQSNELFYTRRGDFHFSSDGFLVNNDGLYVAGFDPNGQLAKISVEVNPVTDAVGHQVLDYLDAAAHKKIGADDATIATAIGQPLATVQTALSQLKVSGYVTDSTNAGVTTWYSNLGQVGDQIEFSRDGVLINISRGLKEGNQLALASFPNLQGLSPSRFGGETYIATDAAVGGGVPPMGAPGDTKLDLGDLETQALEQSTSSLVTSTGFLGILQRNFTSTAAAMKAFMSAWDDLNATLRS